MKTLKKNEEIKGKIVTFKTFRDLLLEELNKSFPEEYDAYVKIRQAEAEAAEAEALAQAQAAAAQVQQTGQEEQIQSEKSYS